MVTRPTRKSRPPRPRIRRALLWGGLFLSLILAPVITASAATTPIPAEPAESGTPPAATGMHHQAGLNAIATNHDRCDADRQNCCHTGDCPEHANCSPHCMNHVPACALLTPPLHMTTGNSLAPVTLLNNVRPYFSPLPHRPPRHY